MIGGDRSASRLAAVQALYQMDLTGKGIHDILPEFEQHWIALEIEGDQYRPAELPLFRAIVEGVLKDQEAIDRIVDETLEASWPLRRVEAVLRAVLRAGTYELMRRKDVPARVAIKEYVDLAAAFFAGEEVGMVNGVLDALARRLRPAEFQPHTA
jgi:N utilization substance protein B